jgi:hypothetical protein
LQPTQISILVAFAPLLVTAASGQTPSSVAVPFERSPAGDNSARSASTGRLSGPVIAAQGRPDFSGEWELVSRSGGAPSPDQTLTVRQSLSGESVRGATMNPPLVSLSIERRSNGDVRSELLTVGVDSGTVRFSGSGRRPEYERTVASRWDGDRLVIETSGYSDSPNVAGPRVTHTEVWSLDGDGLLFIAVAVSVGGSAPTTSTVIYRRRR